VGTCHKRPPSAGWLPTPAGYRARTGRGLSADLLQHVPGTIGGGRGRSHCRQINAEPKANEPAGLRNENTAQARGSRLVHIFILAWQNCKETCLSVWVFNSCYQTSFMTFCCLVVKVTSWQVSV